MKRICRYAVTSLLFAACFLLEAFAAKSPAGYWVATSPFFYDQPVAVIKTYLDANKKLSGQLIKVLPLNQPIDRTRKLGSTGPVMMAGYEQRNGKWVNGRIYEQITARTYSSSITMSGDGNHLYVRGYRGPFFRTARWDRIR